MTKPDEPVQAKTLQPSVSTKDAAALARQLGIAQSKLLGWLGASAGSRRTSKNARLSPRSSIRFRAITALIQEVARMTESEAGHADFDLAVWTGHWLDSPNPALGGMKPLEYLDTEPRRKVLVRLLAQSAAGSFA